MNEGNDAFKDVTVNEDGSVSVTMSKKDYNAFMDELGSGIDDGIKELIDDNSNAFASVDYDKKYETFTVTLSADSVDSMESFMSIAFFVYGGMYQIFDGNENPHIVVKYIGQDGTLLETYDSDNVGGE